MSVDDGHAVQARRTVSIGRASGPEVKEPPAIIVRQLGLSDYEAIWHEMRAFNEHRSPQTADEIWLVEHPPVFTLGMNGRQEHVRDAGDIPVVRTDRGGQVTYHGPGQVVMYVLLDLRRRELGVRALVSLLEQTAIATLARWGIVGQARADAPGVYVDGSKIASLGLRIRRMGSYHGLALNVNPDLSPFTRIDPCGYAKLPICSLQALGVDCTWQQAADALVQELTDRLIQVRESPLTLPEGPARRDHVAAMDPGHSTLAPEGVKGTAASDGDEGPGNRDPAGGTGS